MAEERILNKTLLKNGILSWQSFAFGSIAGTCFSSKDDHTHI
jgi:hypothetical protein